MFSQSGTKALYCKFSNIQCLAHFSKSSFSIDATICALWNAGNRYGEEDLKQSRNVSVLGSEAMEVRGGDKENMRETGEERR